MDEVTRFKILKSAVTPAVENLMHEMTSLYRLEVVVSTNGATISVDLIESPEGIPDYSDDFESRVQVEWEESPDYDDEDDLPVHAYPSILDNEEELPF